MLLVVRNFVRYFLGSLSAAVESSNPASITSMALGAFIQYSSRVLLRRKLAVAGLDASKIPLTQAWISSWSTFYQPQAGRFVSEPDALREF